MLVGFDDYENLVVLHEAGGHNTIGWGVTRVEDGAVFGEIQLLHGDQGGDYNEPVAETPASFMVRHVFLDPRSIGVWIHKLTIVKQEMEQAIANAGNTSDTTVREEDQPGDPLYHE